MTHLRSPGAFAAAALLAATTVGYGAAPAAAQAGAAAERASAGNARDIASRATPAVVEVRALRDGAVVSSGSGFLVRPDGVVATNAHVVQGAATLEIELSTGEVFDNVFSLGADQRRDVVVLKIPATQLPALEIGDASSLAAGDAVFVVGSPLGMQGTFSDGIISARRVIDGVAYLQITAPVSAGSSGGPVLNLAGQVVAITTASITEGQNLNMAIPIGYAEGLLSVATAPVPFAEAELASAAGAVGRDHDDGQDDEAGAAARFLEDPRFEGMEAWERVVVDQLLTVAQRLRSEAFVSTDDTHFGTLTTDSLDHVQVALPVGHYRAVAVCDQDCSDIDLQVSDDDGTVLDTDILDDDVPIVDFTATTPARFHFAVQVVQCSTPTCFYGLQIFRRE